MSRVETEPHPVLIDAEPPQTLPPDPEAFHCEVQPERDAVRVRPTGALDMATAPVLDAELEELRAAGFRRVIVDLGRLHFMDSTGLRLLLQWEAHARQDGFSIALAPGPPAVQRVFEVTGTLQHLPFPDA